MNRLKTRPVLSRDCRLPAAFRLPPAPTALLVTLSFRPGSPSPGSSPLVNLNRYATKKSLAESLLDMALFMSNAVQLKAVLDRGPSSYNYFALVTLLSISLILQVVIGILLVVMALLNLNEVEKQWRLNQLNNAATALIFITVMINIFITAFGAHRIGLLAAGTPL
ncbi:ninjurin-2 isoform X1 [Bos taurus]|uniref:Ninjurin 2 n=1 Tax=Bos taurus TaxID=9913 RepID=A0AAA9SJ15_BOVIN|nr:ninjurin-2 isoform X1 [Bos taurus]